MNFIFVCFYLIAGLICFKMFWQIHKLNKSSNLSDDFYHFSKQMLDYSFEIPQSMKRDYMSWIMNIHTTPGIRELINKGDKESYQKFKEDFYQTWGQHIPSLKKELRDKAIDKILD